MTISPVTEIAYKTKSGLKKRCVLKVYDRGFGQSFRKRPGLPGKGYPVHFPAAESARLRYVSDGKANALFEEIKNSYEQTAILPRRPAQYWIDGSLDRTARYEGALQYEALRHFENETKAYDRLTDLQGQSIPEPAHARLSLGSDANNAEGTNTAQFFRLIGIIMEQIDGLSLDELLSSYLPADRLRNLFERTVDAATEINVRAVYMCDCRSGNIIVRTRNETPFFHDFSQTIIWKPEREEDFVEGVCQSNYPREIAWLLTRGLGIKLGYPDVEREMRKRNKTTTKVHKVKVPSTTVGANADRLASIQGRESSKPADPGKMKDTAASAGSRIEGTKRPPSQSSQDKRKGKGTKLDVVYWT